MKSSLEKIKEVIAGINGSKVLLKEIGSIKNYF
jgi:hypothetical protein